MRGWLKRERLAGWAFFASAVLLIDPYILPIRDPLHFRAYSLVLFRHFGDVLLASILLCLTTAWGAGHQRRWARWTGLLPCSIYLFLGFPYLSPIGAAGLWYLWTQTFTKRELTSEEFWNPRRQSGWTLVASLMVGYTARAGFTMLPVNYGMRSPAEPGLTAFFLLVFVQVAVHEFGHALAAVMVGFKVRVLAVGPFVVTKKSGSSKWGSYQVRFRWNQLILLGGYVGAVPVTPEGLRVKEMLVIAAGPAASLLAAGYLLAVALLLPGTPYAHFLGLTATATRIGFCVGIANLIPVGYCDGTMLFHLLLSTRRGEELLTLLLRAASLGGQESDLADKRETLRRLLLNPRPDPVQLGNHYISLAQTEVSMYHNRDAEAHITEGLALLAGKPGLTAETEGWETLHSMRMSRHDDAGAAEAYANALAAAQRFLAKSKNPLQHVQMGIRISRLHIQAHEWNRALDQTDAALAECPDDEEWRVRKGMLLGYRARAFLQTGCVAEGLQALQQAADIYRASPASAFGPMGIGILGRTLWNAGRTAEGISMISECISLLEAHGQARKTSAFRLNLAEMLLAEGHTAEAASAMPPLQLVDTHLLRNYYEQQGAIHGSERKFSEAIADFSKVLAISEQQSPGEEVPLAEARAGLARILAEAGELEQAETQAGQAREPLTVAGHPDFGRVSIALALIGWRRHGTPGDHVKAALRCWNAARTLLPFQKARRMEEAAKSLESADLAEAASECRSAAAAHRSNPAAAAAQPDFMLAASV
jgi:tetratricopeptide (TPR) repeat protein